MAFADRLELALEARGFSAAIDRDEIYALEEWWKRIETLIGGADTVIFVLSPDSVASDVARKEVAFAASLNKRFAPIVCRRVEDRTVPDALAKFNFIFFDDEFRFEENADRLAQALETDIAWVRQHTDLGEEAHRWSLANQPNGLLLRSPALEGAERLMAARPDGAPPPTEETLSFIRLSRRGATRRRNVLTASLTAGLILALGLAGYAYQQSWAAQQNFSIARETANNMIISTAEGLRDRQAINIATIDIVLSAIDKSVDKLTESHRDNPLIHLSRAAVAFEFAKTYQAAGNHAAALKKATESFDILARITKYERREASPHAFEASELDWRWELSKSLELLGDLKRKEASRRGVEEQKPFRQEAFKWFNEALAVRRQLARTSPERDDWAIGLSQILVRLGDLSREEGRGDTAMDYYEQSLRNAARLFERRQTAARLQRELSWNFNKVGDMKLRAAERKADGDAVFHELTEVALSHFNNSLCIRRKLATTEPQNLLFKRDVSYVLRRIGDARRLRGESSAAEAAYFEALRISMELLDNDARNADYVEDVDTDAYKLGDLFRPVAPEHALAFYHYAADVRAGALQWAANRSAAQERWQSIQRTIEAVQSQIEPDRQAALTGLWWRARVIDATDHFADQPAGLERNPDACWKTMTTSVEAIIGPAPTATVL